MLATTYFEPPALQRTEIASNTVKALVHGIAGNDERECRWEAISYRCYIKVCRRVERLSGDPLRHDLPIENPPKWSAGSPKTGTTLTNLQMCNSTSRLSLVVC